MALSIGNISRKKIQKIFRFGSWSSETIGKNFYMLIWRYVAKKGPHYTC